MTSFPRAPLLALVVLASAGCAAAEEEDAASSDQAFAADDETRSRTDTFPTVVTTIDSYAMTSLSCTNTIRSCLYTVTLRLVSGEAVPLRLVSFPTVPTESTFTPGAKIERRIAELGPEPVRQDFEVRARSADRVLFSLQLETIPARGEPGPTPFTVAWTVTRTR